MEWTTLAGTGLGALVGIGSTLLADRARWRRDSTEQSRQERKEIYVACLTTFRQAHEAMRAVATGDQSRDAVAVDAAVREAFRESGCNEVRETALICVPEELADSIEEAYLSLRKLRDVLAAGNPIDSTEYRESRQTHAQTVWAARSAMRRDLARNP
ncbi:hypothetical protein HLK59_27900 [Streptomyces sp. S3(2020)]|uniref:hypothetical protein n=1 Tax=Streptomyces sp. S3(2020) TaxID=2732044 RepID=UPI0014896DE3|nr:hypothetical protein [Streptomyces sp. S3(2020)]NNN34117.1 hypothetical protein [Streptomyces sp. S3(2020)]